MHETLEYYVSVTEMLRTVGQWIKVLLGQAGVNVSKFSAHSTRAASSSKAAVSLPYNDESTFRKFVLPTK